MPVCIQTHERVEPDRISLGGDRLVSDWHR